MTDLLYTISDFPTKHYTHLLPSLEKNLITTTDLLTLDALDIAKRAQLPLLDVRRLKEHILAALQGQLGLKSELSSRFDDVGKGKAGYGTLRTDGHELVKPRGTISTLDIALDEALGGGIQTGYITEITGESGAGKTQLLLTLLLSAQLPTTSSTSPNSSGLGRPTCYISTEHALPTTRVQEVLRTNRLLSQSPTPPSMSRILTLQTPDLESQDHILTYQLPIALARHNVGLLILDSITANYRAEPNNPAGLATRSAQLTKLGSLLRNLAREHDCAIIVANQVSDRFSPSSSTVPPTTTSTTSYSLSNSRPSPQAGQNAPFFSSSPPSISISTPTPYRANTNTNAAPSGLTPAILSLDHQQRFFTGWGDWPPLNHYHPQPQTQQNLKTPSLGLVWANQIACRVAFIKEEAYDPRGGGGGGDAIRSGENSHGEMRQQHKVSAEWTPKKWRRWMRVVFSPWVGESAEGDKGVEFEIWAGGLRACGPGAGEKGLRDREKEEHEEEEEEEEEEGNGMAPKGE